MTQRTRATIRRPCVLAVALAAFSSLYLSTSVADNAVEHARLAALLRQLDMLERTARESEFSATSGTRYRFDYARLHADIARIRSGIEDYLSPPRAQPRDPVTLNGDYRREQHVSP